MEGIIIGNGVVGKATALSLGLDKYIDLTDSNITYSEAKYYPYIFLCLPTPTVKGVNDISAIEKVLDRLMGYKGVIVIRSTVLPGTAERLALEFKMTIVSNPEFLKFKSADYDATHPEIIVIGQNNKGEGMELLYAYRNLYPVARTILTDTKTAEMIKYAFNNFLTLKIVFANEIYDVCQNIGANYDQVKIAIQSHTSGTTTHLNVLEDGGRGGGGACLPKDTQAFATFTNSELIEVINKINNRLLKEFPKNETD